MHALGFIGSSLLLQRARRLRVLQSQLVQRACIVQKRHMELAARKQRDGARERHEPRVSLDITAGKPLQRRRTSWRSFDWCLLPSISRLRTIRLCRTPTMTKIPPISVPSSS